MNTALSFDLAYIETQQDNKDNWMDNKYPEYNKFYRIGLE